MKPNMFIPSWSKSEYARTALLKQLIIRAAGIPFPITSAIATATYPLGTILRSFVVGLGGRDVTKDEFTLAAKKMEKIEDMRGRLYYYLGVRETKDKLEGI